MIIPTIIISHFEEREHVQAAKGIGGCCKLTIESFPSNFDAFTFISWGVQKILHQSSHLTLPSPSFTAPNRNKKTHAHTQEEKEEEIKEEKEDEDDEEAATTRSNLNRL